MLCKSIYYHIFFYSIPNVVNIRTIKIGMYVFVKATFIAKFMQKLCKFQIDVGPWELPLNLKFEIHCSTLEC